MSAKAASIRREWEAATEAYKIAKARWGSFDPSSWVEDEAAYIAAVAAYEHGADPKRTLRTLRLFMRMKSMDSVE